MKKHRLALWPAAAALMLAASPAAAQNINQDVRCLMVSNLFSVAAKDPKARQLAAIAGFFYLGRLDGRLTDAQLEARIKSEQASLTNANAGSTMQRCGEYMQQRGKALQTIGRKLVPAKKP